MRPMRARRASLRQGRHPDLPEVKAAANRHGQASDRAERALHPARSPNRHLRAGRRRRDVPRPEPRLHRVHVVAIPQSLRGEAVPDRVVAERLIDPGMERLWRPSIQRTDHPVATAVQDMDVSSRGCLRASDSGTPVAGIDRARS